MMQFSQFRVQTQHIALAISVWFSNDVLIQDIIEIITDITVA